MISEQRMPSKVFFIWGMISYWPLRYALVSLCWILFHAWPLLPGLAAKLFFDTLQGKAPAGVTFATVVAFVCALGLAKAGIILAATLTGRSWSFSVRSLLQRNMLARILERPGAKAVPGSVGEALSTMRDDVEPMQLMTDWVFDAVAGLIFAIGGIAILLTVDARVTLLVFVPIVAVILIAHAARTRLEHVRARSRTATARVAGSIGEIFGAVQAIQVAGAEDRVVAHLRRLGDERQRAVLRDRLQGLSLDAIFANTANLGAGLTLLFAASAMRDGSFTVGDFALFATYLMQVAEYTGFLGYLIATWRQSGVAFERAGVLLQGAPAARLVEHAPVYLHGPLPALLEPRAATDDMLEQLDVAGLTLRFPDGGGVEDASFSITRGTLTVITGRIGAGKTTLLRALLGLLEPQAGQVRWNGRLVDAPARFFVPPRVAYTAQVPTLISGPLRENILLGLPEDERLTHAIHAAALERDLAELPDGLDTTIGARGVKLSGGQIQRTAAARMFVRTPQLLVIDDLSSALDVETERELWERLGEREMAKGKGELATSEPIAARPSPMTCVAVSHRPAMLERADQIIVLEHGRVTARGTLRELQQSSAEFRRLYNQWC